MQKLMILCIVLLQFSISPFFTSCKAKENSEEISLEAPTDIKQISKVEKKETPANQEGKTLPEEIIEIGNEEAIKLLSLDLSPKTTSLPVGIKYNFKLTAVYSNGSRKNVTNEAKWTSNNSELSTFDSSELGSLSTLRIGKSSFTVSYENLELTHEFDIVEIEIKNIEISPKVFLLGTTSKIFATAIFTDNSTLDITEQVKWEVNNINIANIDINRKLSGIAPGSTSVKAIYNSQKGGATTIEVRLKKLKKIDIQYQTNVLVLGTTASFKAIGHFEDESTENITHFVTWSSSDPAIIDIEYKNENSGKALAISSGKVQISASLDDLTETIEVDSIIANFKGLTIEPDISKIPIGLVKQFYVYGILENDSKQDITNNVNWMSTDEQFFTVENSGENIGKILAVSKGVASLTVTYGNYAATKNLQIIDPAVVNLKIEELEKEMFVCGIDTPILIVTGEYSDGTTADLSNSITWESSDPTKVTVENSVENHGKVTSFEIGEYNLIATYLDPVTNTTVTNSIAYKSDNPVVISSYILPSMFSLPIGTSFNLLNYLDYSCGEDVEVTSDSTFTSNNTTIANLSSENQAQGLVLTSGSLSEKTTVRFTSIYQDFEANLDIEIRPQEVTSIVIQSAEFGGTSLEIAETSQMKAFSFYTNGDSAEITNEANWTTTSNKFSVDNNTQKGLITGISEGEAKVKASFITSYGNFYYEKDISIYSICPPGGTKESFFCIYLGDKGDSCTTTCAKKGATNHPKTIEKYGSLKENSDSCESAFSKLKLGNNLEDGNATLLSNKGIGCSAFEYSGAIGKYRFTNVETNYDDSDPNYKRVCACTH